jgi:hypothetical protein
VTLKNKDWIGRKFGRLTVVALEKIPGAGTVVVCECQCGNVTRCKNHNLIRGSTKSCGCLWKEKITTHGMTSSRAYASWKGMRSRCYCPTVREWHNYGGRGIKVCDRWLYSFENFLADMGEPPEGRTLDRVENDGDYEPGNCEWATYEEQLNNTRSNRMVTAFGKTQSLARWAKEYSLAYTTLKNRLFRANMDPEEALTVGLFAQKGRPKKRERLRYTF